MFPSGHHGKVEDISKEKGEQLMNEIVKKFAEIIDADLMLKR